jgi:hypothetical protein
MIALWLQLGLAHGGADPVADALTEALRIELDLALETLHLPGHPSPHFIAYEVLDGQVATAEASLGAIVIESQVPHRKLRVDVRVGSPALDSSNFSSFGARGGVEARGLPLEPNVVAFRREIWLATDEAHKGAVETYATKMAAREGQPGPFLPDQAPAKSLQGEPIPVPAVDLGALSELTRTLSGMWREVPGIEKAQVTARDWQGRRLLLTSEGAQIWMPTGATVVRLTAAVRNDAGALVHTHRNWVARSPADLPTLAQMEDEVASARDWLMAAKAAPVEEEFLGPVIFEGPAAVELFRQLLLPEISGTPPEGEPPDPFGDPIQPLTHARLGRRLLPDGWTVVDDPVAHPELPGASALDFEGVPTQRVEVVQGGVLREVLMSRIPRADRTQSNGHGRGLGVERREGLPSVVEITPPRSRSTKAMHRAAHKLARQAGVPHVLLIRQMEAPAMSEDFQVAFSGDGPLSGLTQPLEVVRLYPGGREEPVRGLEFVGADRRVLRDIVMAGPMHMPTGVMDAGPGARRRNIGSLGGLPASWTVPTVLVAELELRGRSGVDPRTLSPPPRDQSASISASRLSSRD